MRCLITGKRRVGGRFEIHKGILNGLVRVTDAGVGRLKRWETQRGKPMAVMDNGRLVLTRVGRNMGYKIRKKDLVKT